MKQNLDLEKRVKKLLKANVDDKYLNKNDFIPKESQLNWAQAISQSLVSKAASGDISAIKYINELLQENETEEKDKALEITVTVVE